MNKIILALALVVGFHASADPLPTPTPPPTPTPWPTQAMPFPVTDPPSEDELMLAPLLDLRNGGQATGAAQGTGPTQGGLVNGTLLPESGLGYKAGHRETDRWATGMMASFIVNSAPLVLQKNPTTLLRIGGIAQEFGGPYSPHSSHQSGLDADIQFVGTVKYGTVINKDDTINTTLFDVDQNWSYWRLATMQQIKVGGKVRSAVSMILVDPRIKTWLCAWAKQREATLDPLDYEVLARLRPTVGHDDHFHLRFTCSPHYATCIAEHDSSKKLTGCSEFDPAPKH